MLTERGIIWRLPRPRNAELKDECATLKDVGRIRGNNSPTWGNRIEEGMPDGELIEGNS